MTMTPTKHPVIAPELKLRARMMPFVTFPLTKKCNFRCQYCGYGGEMSASMEESQDYDVLYKRIFAAHKVGVRKFRLTGGEPFLYPQIEDLVKIFNELGIYLLINTNGSLIDKYEHIFEDMQDNINFAVSLDTMNPSVFDLITGTKGLFGKVKKGIEIIKLKGRLYRLNMVVNKLNEAEVFDIIDYCAELGCNLKLLDVVSVPLPFGNREDLHVSLTKLEKKLAKISESIKVHQYARSFGTPCFIYKYRGVHITVKSTWNGSRYDIDGLCDSCPYFPCHEGLYDVFSLPDYRVVGCRWSEQSVEKTGKSFEEKLENLAKAFQRASYVGRERNQAMIPRPNFVVDSLIRAGKKVALINV